MTDLYTTEEAACVLGWSYDYTRKRLATMEPAQLVGKRLKMWTAEQLKSLKAHRGLNRD